VTHSTSPPSTTLRASVDFSDLTVDDVSRHFGRRRAVSRISFQASRGSVLGLLGPNGAGKSTLLAMLATLLRPSTGRIRYGTYDATEQAAALRGAIGVLGHDLFLYPELTAQENLEFFAALYGVEKPRDAASRALQQAGLADRAGDLVSSFSRGMRQRVALERALIHGPRLLLLDEPFTGLDDASTGVLAARLGSLRQAGAIVIVATHDLDLADGMFDRAVFLREGRMLDVVDRPGALRSTYRDVMSRA
jgi:heme ABC exporter ATP-binding subunit CcmA